MERLLPASESLRLFAGTYLGGLVFFAAFFS
jgi:hypothetical protein